MTNYQPDILAEGLDVVFSGINPATTAVIAGHNFSTGSNRFWATLQLAGFTDRRLQPREEQHLLAYGCGIAAIVDRPTRRADEIGPAEYCGGSARIRGQDAPLRAALDRLSR